MRGRWGDLSPQQEEALRQVGAVDWGRREELLVSLSRRLLPPQFKEAVADLPDKPDDSSPYYLRWLRGASEQSMFGMSQTNSLSLLLHL